MTIFKIQEHRLQASYIREYPRALVDEHDDGLVIVAKQYTPLDNPAPHDGDITIVGAHANGFPKVVEPQSSTDTANDQQELYEPLWEELYHRMKELGHRIRNIFIADVAWQGQSGVLNASKIANDPNWMDTSRDLLLMVNHFRNDIKRPIIGIGHSMGGNNLVNLSHLHPRLFTSLVLVDPVIVRRLSGAPAGAAMSSLRRDRWPNRPAAEASFQKSKFYQAWDPRVLKLWFQFGLREVPQVVDTTNNATPETDMEGTLKDPEVELTTSKHQEVFTFIRAGPATKDSPAPYPQPGLPVHLTHPDINLDAGSPSPFYRPELRIAFDNLYTLRPSTLFVFCGRSELSLEELNADKLAVTGTGAGGSGGVTAGRVKGVMMKKAGHLVPFEDVNGVAEQCIAWIVPELARYIEETALIQRDWDRIPVEKKAVLSEGELKSLRSFLPPQPPKKAAGAKL